MVVQRFLAPLVCVRVVAGEPVVYKDKQKQRDAWNRWYYKHKETENKNRYVSRKERRIKLQNLANRYKAYKGCNKCGIKNPIILDFHHIKEKSFNVATGIAHDYKRERIKNEIRKCIVLCANCHRIIHSK